METVKNSNGQIKKGAIISYASILFNIISGLIYTPWMVRQIGQADYGLYTLVGSVISYFTLDFGFGGAISRFIARYRAEKNEDKIGELLGLVYKFYFLLDVLIFVALVVIYFCMSNIFVSLTETELEKFRIIFVITGLFTLVSFPCSPFNGILIAYEKFIALKSCDLLTKVFTVVLMVIALLLGYRLYALVIVNAAVQLLINIVKFKIVKKNVKQKVDFKYFDKSLLKTVFSFSIWITVISIAQRFIMNITPTVLGITAGAVEISIFAVGRTIEGYTFTFANALNSLFLPKVSRMVANNAPREDITDLMIKVGRVQLIIVGAIITIFISMGQEFVVLWMGENFKNSYIVTVLLILPSIITLTQDIGYTLLVVENEVKYRAAFYVLSAIVSVGLSLTLSRICGAIGAAIAIFIATLLGHVICMNWVYKKKMGLGMNRFYKQCHIKALPVFIIVMISGFILQRFAPVNNFMLFVLKLAVIGIEYIILMWFFYLNNMEKENILGIVRKVCNVFYKK